jgi:hypothetical protein
MKIIPFAAIVTLIALPAFSEPAPWYGTEAAAATGIPADPNCNSNAGVTHGTEQEALSDLSNGRTVDRNGEPNTTAHQILSQQEHAMGQFTPNDPG